MENSFLLTSQKLHKLAKVDNITWQGLSKNIWFVVASGLRAGWTCRANAVYSSVTLTTVCWEVINLRIISLLVQIFVELIKYGPIFNPQIVSQSIICWMCTWLAQNRNQLSKWTLWLRDEPHKWNWNLNFTKKNQLLLKEIFLKARKQHNINKIHPLGLLRRQARENIILRAMFTSVTRLC